MRFRREVRSFIEEVRSFIAKQKTEKEIIAILVSEVTELRKEKRDLMDRLMARNFEELRIYQKDEDTEIDLTATELEPDQDEQNAGDIV